MAEITINWRRNTPDPVACWECVPDAVAEAVTDLLDAAEGSDILDDSELDRLLRDVSRMALEITLAVRTARRGCLNV